MDKTPVSFNGFELACPACCGRLEEREGGIAVACASCGRAFACQDGIWRFLLPGREEQYQAFLAQYRRVRQEEGWGRPSPDYFRELPWVEPDDPQRATWERRARHYQVFIRSVLTPLEARLSRPLKIVDLGAGNGWLSNRLSQRGHHLAAVDINLDALDGLGASGCYSSAFLPVQAEFERLPFAPGEADLVVYNGALHYSRDYPSGLAEALRILNPAGLLAVLDTPVYRDAASGEAMLGEKSARFQRLYGFSGVFGGSQNYLTWEELDNLSRSCAISWQAFWPRAGWRRVLGRIWSGLKLRREAAQFPILAVTPHPQWKPSLPRRVLRRLATPVLRGSYRWFYEPRARQPRLEKIAGRSFRVLPGVFDPVLFRTGAYLAGQLDPQLIPPGCSVLDLGTGSGVGAVCAARWAARIVAVDINPQAVRCAQENFALNQLGKRAKARLGDLFAPLGDERFDVVLFNPPFLRGVPEGTFEGSFYSTDLAARFAAGLGEHLNPAGYALLLLSSLGDAPSFLQALRWRGFFVRSLRQKTYSTEKLTLFQVTPAPKREFDRIEKAYDPAV